LKVVMTLPSGMGCPVSTREDELDIELVIRPTPILEDTYLCAGESKALDVSGTYAGVGAWTTSYQWYQDQSATGTGESTLTLENEADYSVTVTNISESTGHSCSGVSNEITVPEFFASEQASIATSNFIIDLRETGTLSEEAMVEGNAYNGLLPTGYAATYNWSIVDDNGSNSIVSTASEGREATFEMSETATLQYTVSIEQCTSEDFITITVYEPVIVPEVFTPNGDGINDDWQIEGLEAYDNPRIKVYNRWGGKVLDEDFDGQMWTGQNKMEKGQCSDGVYYYLIELNDELETVLNGNVTILR